MMRLREGGLAQVTSFNGGSKTWFALTCLSTFLENHHGDPPLSLWISDEAYLYPETIYSRSKIPLSRLLFVKVDVGKEAWRVTLESVQTGLFLWVLLRTQASPAPAFLRKLQLCAEKSKTRVMILSQTRLPHWTLKTSVDVERYFQTEWVS